MPEVFETEVSNRHREMIALLESIDIESLKSEGLRISVGGKTLRFKDLEVINDENVEDRIRNEYKEKLNRQQQTIREKINSKINQLLVMHQQKQKELDRKEEQLKRKYSQFAMMPDISGYHLTQGLSVVKGNSNNELTWIYRAKYNPRFIIYYPGDRFSDSNKVRKPLPPRLVNRMKTDMLILIKTKDNKVLSVVTRKLHANSRGNLEPFPHYHQQTSNDCWGSWRPPKEYNNPNDILKIAKEAESILETINQGSLAEQNPTGLVRVGTILKAIEEVDEIPETIISTRDVDNESDSDIWNSM